jgi:hypothetical protein
MSVDPGASRVGKVNQEEAIVNRREQGGQRVQRRQREAVIVAGDPYLRSGLIWASVWPAHQWKNGITGKDDRTC